MPVGIENKIKYREWLKHSDKWSNVRIEALVWQKMFCQGCGKEDFSNDAHHIFYPKRWEDTKFWQLRILCRSCHNQIHKLTQPKKYQYRIEAENEYTAAINVIRKSVGLMPITRHGKRLTPRKRLNRLKMRLAACNPFRNVKTERVIKRVLGKCSICESEPEYTSVKLKTEAHTKTKLCLDCFHFWITAKPNNLNEFYVRGRIKKKRLLSRS